MWLVLVTFGCFVLANIASTIMVQAEARNRSIIAGAFEALYALFWIFAAKYALSTSPKEIVALIIGNFLGAWLGTKVGERWVKDEDEEEAQMRFEDIEEAIEAAEAALKKLRLENELHHGPDDHAHS